MLLHRTHPVFSAVVATLVLAFVGVAGASPAAAATYPASVETGAFVDLPETIYGTEFGSVPSPPNFNWSAAGGTYDHLEDIWLYGSQYWGFFPVNGDVAVAPTRDICAVDAATYTYTSDYLVANDIYTLLILIRTTTTPPLYAAVLPTDGTVVGGSSYLDAQWWLQTDGTGTFCGAENHVPTADPGGPYLAAVSQSFTVEGSGSSDPDSDPLTYTWSFQGTTGSGASTPFTAPETPGIYPLELTVDDGAGGADSASTSVVVYDPTAGFVTGGGWIESPPGAYTTDPSLTGQAGFGFVSKYQKGKAAPVGETEFVFTAGPLELYSNTYDWLVVTQGGAAAQFKGSATVNGASGYRFMVWAGDNSTDTFRIRIWSENASGDETVIYDNGTAQPLGGGSIVIHVAKK